MCVPKFSVPNLDENQKYQNHPTLYALFSIAIYQIIVVFWNQLKYYSYILYHKKNQTTHNFIIAITVPHKKQMSKFLILYTSFTILYALSPHYFVKGHNHDFIWKCSFFHFFKIYTMFHQRVYDSQSYFESSNNELNSEPSILLYAKFKPIFSLYIECCWIQNTRFKKKLNVANTSICLFTFVRNKHACNRIFTSKTRIWQELWLQNE